MELWALQLPGRETRLREEPWTDCSSLAAAIAETLDVDIPLVLYGHSFGALLAFEVAHLLSRRGARPLSLVVSGRRGPRCVDRESPIALLSDQDFLEQVALRYGGLPQAVLRSQELLEIVLPALRADMGITEGYRYHHSGSLRLPILAFGGDKDNQVSRAELSRWREETRGPFELRMMSGGHFFHMERREELLVHLDDWLTQHALE